jgi:hypothetical protein
MTPLPSDHRGEGAAVGVAVPVDDPDEEPVAVADGLADPEKEACADADALPLAETLAEALPLADPEEEGEGVMVGYW